VEGKEEDRKEREGKRRGTERQIDHLIRKAGPELLHGPITKGANKLFSSFDRLSIYVVFMTFCDKADCMQVFILDRNTNDTCTFSVHIKAGPVPPDTSMFSGAFLLFCANSIWQLLVRRKYAF
jgi:hypothetical protein